MPLLQPFNQIVQTTKKNNRYYGPTESQKISSYFSEIQSDLTTLFSALNNVQQQFNVIASGYFTLESTPVTLYNMKAQMATLLDTINNRIYVQSENIPTGK